MVCMKRGFMRKASAQRAMLLHPVKPGGRMPVRVYYCNECLRWHYTSKPVMKGNRNA